MINYLEIANKKYYINLNNIINFISNINDNEQKKQKVKIEQWGYTDSTVQLNNKDIKLVSKEIQESSENNNEVTYNIKYDLIKTLFSFLQMNEVGILNELDILGTLAFNTLLSYKIIEEAK